MVFQRMGVESFIFCYFYNGELCYATLVQDHAAYFRRTLSDP